jgi:hypothetical protein|tara:strand:+ start:137 stop:304 length:168 start_codon:yes stop_codon:yes gene_type:complete
MTIISKTKCRELIDQLKISGKSFDDFLVKIGKKDNYTKQELQRYLGLWLQRDYFK